MNIRTWLLCAVVAVISLPAFAQRYYYEDVITADSESASYDLDKYLDNPCTSYYDQVWVDYNVYLEKEYADAENRYMFAEMTSMAGTYQAAGQSTSDIVYAAPFTIRKYHKVNTPDNFHVVTVINFYPSTRETYVSIETACGNGMPDSAQ